MKCTLSDQDIGDAGLILNPSDCGNGLNIAIFLSRDYRELYRLRLCSIHTDLKIVQWSGLLRIVCPKRTSIIDSSGVAANLEIVWAT